MRAAIAEIIREHVMLQVLSISTHQPPDMDETVDAIMHVMNEKAGSTLAAKDEIEPAASDRSPR